MFDYRDVIKLLKKKVILLGRVASLLTIRMNKFVEFKMTGGQIFKIAIGKLTNIWTAQLLFVSNTNLTKCTPSLTLIATRIQPLEVVICYQYQEGV